MLRIIPRRAALPACVAALIVLAFTSGCGDGVGKTYPVSGKVTVDGAALNAKSAVVMFVPDRDKGNTTTFEPGGTINSNGSYTLYTKGHRGAPPGWYKVVVSGVAADPPAVKGPLTHRPVPKSLVPPQYGQAKTTPLAIEVVPSPASGSYDLNLKP